MIILDDSVGVSHCSHFTLRNNVNKSLIIIRRCCYSLTRIQQSFFAAYDFHGIQFLCKLFLKVIIILKLVFSLLLFVEADDDLEVAKRDDDLADVQGYLTSECLRIRPVSLRELNDVVDHVAEQQHYHEDGEGYR